MLASSGGTSVCDHDGNLVAGLSVDAFGCVASSSSGAPSLVSESFVEAHPGCYRLACQYEPQVCADVLTISVRQRVRTNPLGLTPVYGTAAEGHVLVSWQRATDA